MEVADAHGAKQHGVKQHGAKQHGAKQHGAKQHGAKQHGAKQHGDGQDEDRWTEDDMNRRSLLKALGLGAASLGQPRGARDAVIEAAHTSALLRASIETYGIGRRTIDHARAQLAKLATDYVLTSDLESILRELVVIRNHLALFATSRHHPSESRDVYRLAGATCLLLASISHDLSEPHAGMTQTETAATFAELSGDQSLLAWVSCTKAMIASWWGTPESVLQHTALARARKANGGAAIRLGGLEARALAELGRRSEAVEVMHASDDERASVGEHSPLRELGEVFTFPLARQHYYNAATHRHLGDWEDVEREAGRVVDLYSATSSGNTWPVTVTLSQIYQAEARLHVHGPAGARDALEPVFSIPQGQHLPQTVQALSGLLGALRAHALAALPAARDLDEEITAFHSAKTSDQ